MAAVAAVANVTTLDKVQNLLNRGTSEAGQLILKKQNIDM